MTVEKPRKSRPAGGKSIHGIDILHECRHARRIPARLRGKDLAAAIGIAFLVAPIRGELPHSHEPDGERIHTHIELLSAGRMTFGRMSNFVTDHAGEFVLAVDQCQKSSGDIDIPTGECECVGSRLVDDMERVVERSNGREGEHSFPDGLDIGLELGVIDHPHLFFHGLRGLGAQTGIIKIADQDDVS